MPNVVFVAPFVMESTLRFVRAAAGLSGVRLCVLSQDPSDRVPAELQQQLHGYQQVRDALDTEQLTDGVRALARQLGSIDVLLSVLEPLQVPLAEVRGRLRISGMDAATARNFRDKARMKELLAAHELPCARHRLCSSSDAAREFAAEVGFPLVGKPPAGAGARTTSRLADAAELQAFLDSSPPTRTSEVLLEEFVQGREFSFVMQGRG